MLSLIRHLDTKDFEGVPSRVGDLCMGMEHREHASVWCQRIDNVKMSMQVISESMALVTINQYARSCSTASPTDALTSAGLVVVLCCGRGAKPQEQNRRMMVERVQGPGCDFCIIRAVHCRIASWTYSSINAMPVCLAYRRAWIEHSGVNLCDHHHHHRIATVFLHDHS